MWGKTMFYVVVVAYFLWERGRYSDYTAAFRLRAKVRKGDLKMAAVSHLYDGRVTLRETKADSVSLYCSDLSHRDVRKCGTEEKQRVMCDRSRGVICSRVSTKSCNRASWFDRRGGIWAPSVSVFAETLPTVPCPRARPPRSEVDKHRLWSSIERRPVLPPFD